MNGGGWGHSDWDNPGGTAGPNLSGGLVGGTLGYNYQVGQTVFGVGGDIDWSNIRGSAACGGISCETRNSWLSTVRGRIGYTFDRFMPFVTGGAAFGDIKATPVGFGSETTTKTGWTLGGGLEAAAHRTVDRQGRISLCRSRQGNLRRGLVRRCDRRELPDQHCACRSQLSLLIQREQKRPKAPDPGPRSGAFFVLELGRR